MGIAANVYDEYIEREKTQPTLPFLSVVDFGMRLTDIPMPPSANNLYATVSINGRMRRIKSSGFQKWQRDFLTWTKLHFSAIKSLKSEIAQMKPKQVLAVHTEFYFNRSNIITLKGYPKRNDTSNRLKAIHDAIADLIEVDDSYFWDGAFTKRSTQNEHSSETCTVELRIIEIP